MVNFMYSGVFIVNFEHISHLAQRKTHIMHMYDVI